MKEENIRVNYKTIDIVEQRGLLEITRSLGRLLTEEEFDEIMMVYKKVTDRLLAEVEKQGEERREVEMTLFTKNKENWTRFKVGVKQIYTIPPKVLLVLGEPTKKTNRFYYWEKKGDFLNGRDLD